jgi:hypothetical protein
VTPATSNSAATTAPFSSLTSAAQSLWLQGRQRPLNVVLGLQLWSQGSCGARAAARRLAPVAANEDGVLGRLGGVDQRVALHNKARPAIEAATEERMK